MSDRLADTICLLHVPHAPTFLQSEAQPPAGFKRRIYEVRGGSHIYETHLEGFTQLHTPVKRFGRNLSSMKTEITILASQDVNQGVAEKNNIKSTRVEGNTFLQKHAVVDSVQTRTAQTAPRGSA